MSVARTQLPNSGLCISRLVLGLGQLHRILTRRAQDRLIHAALDLGITHFDAARLYGDGAAESAVGRAIRSRGEDITVTTKFGLSGNPSLQRLGPAAPVFRGVRKVALTARLATWPRLRHQNDHLWEDLHNSLRCLGTDHIDLYMLHEPSLVQPCMMDDLIATIHVMRDTGKVRHLGLAGARAQEIVARYPGAFDVLQTSEAEWVESRMIPDITYGVLSAVPDQPPAIAYVRAARRRPEGGIIVGTRDAHHLHLAVQALS